MILGILYFVYFTKVIFLFSKNGFLFSISGDEAVKKTLTQTGKNRSEKKERRNTNYIRD
jgi:hypothetical protein